MLIGDMDISWLTVYEHQVEEENLGDRVKYGNKKAKTGTSLDNRKVVQIIHSSWNKRDMHHHLLVLMHPEIEVSIMARIRRII